MDQTPALSWLPDASMVHGGLAEYGLRDCPDLGLSIFYVFPCLDPGCTVTYDDVQTLDHHIKTAHRTVPPGYNLSKLIAIANETQSADERTIATPGLSPQVPNSVTLSTPVAPPRQPTTTTPPTGPLVCACPNCGQTFTRNSDLIRHGKKYLNGPKVFECPVEGFDRKGENGFDRSDKLRDHLNTKKHMGFGGEI
ncbi:MAG: hypothetical protein MMC33_010743 [Icmadophila ericetorum]|nr:hypothetical protein [Icmadophila ericetorum]